MNPPDLQNQNFLIKSLIDSVEALILRKWLWIRFTWCGLN